MIINWGRKEGDASMNGYDMTTGKNWGILTYLRSLPREAENDLVIMVDAHDAVFQLPLEITLKRYQDMRVQTDARLLRQHGEEAVRNNSLKQTIIMGAEKHCWPLSHTHPACWAVPDSDLRKDAYGNTTDQTTETNRPRFLCSGTIMGPVGDMIKLYEWAHLQWLSYDTWGGDQDYFNNIYGRQELSRHKLRSSKEWIFSFGEKYKDDELTFPHMETNHTDYHLGVDLTSGIFQSLNAAIVDMSSVVHNNLTDLDAKDKEHGTADIYQAQFPFPEDLVGSPFGHDEQLASDWRDVRLFTNFHARTIPAILHYNGDKTKMDDWWHRQWWTGHGREIVSARTDHANIRTDNERQASLKWTDMCGQFADEVFVDPVEPWE
jgi:hypothetical protein